MDLYTNIRSYQTYCAVQCLSRIGYIECAKFKCCIAISSYICDISCGIDGIVVGKDTSKSFITDFIILFINNELCE